MFHIKQKCEAEYSLLSVECKKLSSVKNELSARIKPERDTNLGLTFPSAII